MYAYETHVQVFSVTPSSHRIPYCGNLPRWCKHSKSSWNPSDYHHAFKDKGSSVEHGLWPPGAEWVDLFPKLIKLSMKLLLFPASGSRQTPISPRKTRKQTSSRKSGVSGVLPQRKTKASSKRSGIAGRKTCSDWLIGPHGPEIWIYNFQVSSEMPFDLT